MGNLVKIPKLNKLDLR